jgi:CRISPR-associated protein (TIGR02584 family)
LTSVDFPDISKSTTTFPMTAGQKQIVLLSLVGTAPAVLSETVWALATQEVPVIPDKIIVMTTSTGAVKIKEKLFEQGHWQRMLKALEQKGLPVAGRLRFGPIGASIRVFADSTQSRELDDIRTAEDNEAVAEFFMETIRSFVENDSIRLIVSIAGGRKTTSALLYSVMSLLGRAEDQIQHILVDDHWIFQHDFMYPGCDGVFIDRDTGNSLSSADAKLQLVDVPFVPLRYLFEGDLQRSAGSFVELINQVRARTINVTDDLVVQLLTNSGEFNVSGQVVSLSPNEFLFYLYFAKRVLDGQPPLGGYGEIGDALEDLNDEYRQPGNFSHWTHKTLSNYDPTEDPRKWASSIRAKLRTAGFDSFQVERLVPRNGHLAIELPKESISIEA